MSGSYDFTAIEAKWQQFWEQNKTFRSANPGDADFAADKPKFYILDMFPYPSGAGLHVGHPEGYTATDIIARYKRMKGFNVLHPMGYDAFGLPAEQYAVEHGVHPRITTERNINNIRRQIKALGFSYDWDRELATTDPDYYRWTQWIFMEMFNSWYDDQFVWTDEDGREYRGRARPIGDLSIPEQVRAEGERAVARYVDSHRLAYIAEAPVNWCPALGTVLANEEVTNDGLSERGNHPVYRRPLKQWLLGITKYAQRLLDDLDQLDWPESIKIMQRNWIGRSEGADVDFPLAEARTVCPDAPSSTDEWFAERAESGLPAQPSPYVIRVFTTRPDTLFGATYMVLAPEHPLVEKITTAEHRDEVRRYVEAAERKSELDRTDLAKEKTGVFTGAYAVNPVNRRRIPIWVADYVMIGYGTGAIMAVPAHDERDFEFAKRYELPIVAVVMPPDEWIHQQIVANGLDVDYCRSRDKEQMAENLLRSAGFAAGTIAGITAQSAQALLDGDQSWLAQVARPVYLDDPGIFIEAFVGEGENVSSPPRGGQRDETPADCQINGLATDQAKKKINVGLERQGLGRFAVNYRLRDWLFSRQHYWGEPFPILHGPDGELVGLKDQELPVLLPEIEDFTPKALAPDSSELPETPLARRADWVEVRRDGKSYRRETNTMPQWAGSCWYYLRYLSPRDGSRFCDLMAERYWMPVDLYVGGAEHAVLHLLYARFWHKVLYDLGHVTTAEPFSKLFNQGMILSFAYRDSRGVCIGYEDIDFREDGAYHKQSGDRLSETVEKMSKSLQNVVNPDEAVCRYGADTFRLYEMYMGPLDSSKPWNPRDVPGVHRFLHRVWRLVVDQQTGRLSDKLLDGEPDEQAERLIHRTIMHVEADLDQMRFNTAIAHMIVFVNEMTRRDRRPRSVIERFLLVLAAFSPHIAEELWQRLGHSESLAYESWPRFDPELARVLEVEIAVQISGKVRARLTISADASEDEMQQAAMEHEKIRQELEGKTVRKVICVPGRLVNIVAK